MGRIINTQYNKLNSAINQNPTSSTYPEYVRNQLQEKVDKDWDFASDRYDVLKQNIDKIWETKNVRLVFPYEIKSSSTIKDDFKTVLYKDLQYKTNLGELYQWDSNYYLTIDTGRNKSATSSAMLRRCTDYLRWFDENGIYHELPCIVEKSVMYDLDNDRVMSLPTNQIRILVQWNEESEKIKWADVNSSDDKFTRFILAKYAYRTVSIDRHSFIRNDMGYLDIRCQTDMIKETDDLINGIADALSNNVIVAIQNDNPTLQIGESLQLNVSVTKNEISIVNPVLTYSSNASGVASINANGLITANSIGNAVITVTYGNKTDTINLNISAVATPNYTIDFTASNSNLSTLKLNQTNTYTVNAMNNGVSYSDTFTFNVTDDTGLMPSGMVTIISTVGNSITLKASNINSNVNQYFRLYAIGTNKTDYIRIQIKSIF